MRTLTIETLASVVLLSTAALACEPEAEHIPVPAGTGAVTSSGATSGVGATGATGAEAGTGAISGSPGGTGGVGGTGGTGAALALGGTSPATGGSGVTGGASNVSGLELLTSDAISTGLLTAEPTYGVKGALYTYGDTLSCTTATGNPCTAAGCCISGKTQVDPTYAAWGCGIGMSLNATTGDTAKKSPYAGTLNGFIVTITGTGGPFRINLTQVEDSTGKVAPYYQVAKAGTYTVKLSDFTYPSWCATNKGCMGLQGKTPDLASAYDLQVQVPGGDAPAVAFDYCITSVKAF